MLVHSYLYYEKDENIVDDSTWSKWAMELVDLQTEYPEIAEKVDYADQFKDWDGSSGAFLTFDQDIRSIAIKLLHPQPIKLVQAKPMPKQTKLF